jgi:DNA-binding transcriptional ArsR family regulator
MFQVIVIEQLLLMKLMSDAFERALAGQIAYSTRRLTIPGAHRIVAGMSDPLDLVFAALADPTRRAILAMLLEDDMAVTDVAEPFAMSLAAISKHLGVLADAGLISRERRGRVIWCKLEPDAMRTASVWMQGFGQFEPLDLDAFEKFLAAELGPELDEAGSETVTAGNAKA